MKNERKVYLPLLSGSTRGIFSIMAKKSKKRSKLFKPKKMLPWAFGVLAVVAVAFVVMGIINLKKPDAASDTAAYVSGEAITMKELDYSYQYALPEEYKKVMTKWEFLNESVIPQKLLLQEALKNNITVTNEEVKMAINEMVQFSGLTAEEFEKQLGELKLEWDDVELTYWTRLTISKFVEENIFNTVNVTKAELQRAYNKAELEVENISLEEATPYLKEDILLEKQSAALLEFLEQLRQNATILILLDEAKQGITSFSQTGKACNVNGTIPVYMFTVSTCKECLTIASRLSLLLQSYEKDGSSPFTPYLWELDTGDNLYTKAIEQGVPSGHVATFKRISPEGKAPAYSFGCAYTRVGHFPGAEGNINAEEEEFSAVLSALLVQNE